MSHIRRLTKRSSYIAALIAALLGGAYFFFYVFTPTSYINAKEISLTNFPELKTTDRITVVAPHLDDEGLGVGGLVAEARQRGIPVSVIFMTNGDANRIGAALQYGSLSPTPAQYIEYGKVRQYEAMAATQRLGIPSNEVYFLGLPDRGLAHLLEPEFYTNLYTSNYTQVSKTPYELTAIPGLEYTGKTALATLTNLINQTRPTLLFASLPQDKHTDHAATGRFVKAVLPDLTSHPRPYLYLVHYPKYPLPRGINPSYPLLPPQKLSNLNWQRIPLSTEIVEIKRQSVESYISQLRVPLLGRLLRSLVRKNELVVDGF